MAEASQPNPENLPVPDVKKYQEQARALFTMIERMSELVDPAPNPEPGIEKWFKMDVPMGSFGHIKVEDCNGVEVEARAFEAKLHEQDSNHEVWEFRFSNKAEGDSERHVAGMVIKSKTGFEFLLSPVGGASEETTVSTFKTASSDQVSYYYDDYLYNIDAEVRMLAAGYDSIGYDSPDAPGQKADWEHGLGLLAEDGATIPGLLENGHLIKK